MNPLIGAISKWKYLLLQITFVEKPTTFKGYRCESGIVIFVYWVIWNYAYSPLLLFYACISRYVLFCYFVCFENKNNNDTFHSTRTTTVSTRYPVVPTRENFNHFHKIIMILSTVVLEQQLYLLDIPWFQPGRTLIIFIHFFQTIK